MFKQAISALAVVAACVFSAPATADSANYAAIWSKEGGPAFVARHGMTASQYQQEFDKWTGQGYCLTLVDGYGVGTEAHYAAIWLKQQCPAYVARHGLTSAQYQQEFDKWTGQGYRLRLVSGYSVNGADHYAAIWVKAAGPDYVARHGLNAQAYQQEFDKWTGQGYCLTLVSGYSAGGQDRYAAIWEKKQCPAYVARHGLNPQAYQQEFDKWTGQGYRLTLVSAHQVGGKQSFAAIWTKTSGPQYIARHGLTSDQYQQEFDKLLAQGYRLDLVSGY